MWKNRVHFIHERYGFRMNIVYKNCFFLFVIIASVQNPVMANFGSANCDNAGTMSLTNSNFRVRETFNNTGKVIAQETNECVCGTLTGDGLFKGHIINIIAKDFQFSGVIECDGECHITTAKPFDHSICTFSGNGTVEFIIDEHAYDVVFSEEEAEPSVAHVAMPQTSPDYPVARVPEISAQNITWLGIKRKLHNLRARNIIF